MKLIVTGTGRSGTAYIHNMLVGYFGVKMGHERIFSIYGRAGWGEFEGDSTWCAPAYSEHIAREDLLYHVMRDPLKVLRSHVGTMMDDSGLGIWGKDYALTMTVQQGSFLKFWYDHCPEAFANDTGDPLVDQYTRCIRYIYFWNNRIEEMSANHDVYMVHRLEDINYEEMSMMLGLMGRNYDTEAVRMAFEEESVKRNVRVNNLTLDWDFIDSHPEGHLLRELAEKYGY